MWLLDGSSTAPGAYSSEQVFAADHVFLSLLCVTLVIVRVLEVFEVFVRSWYVGIVRSFCGSLLCVPAQKSRWMLQNSQESVYSQSRGCL